MADLEARIQGELERVVEAVEAITGLSSRWSGKAVLVQDAGFKGKKRFGCDIEINAALAASEVRWSTLIHEVLQSVSGGYNPSDFQTYRGWEEGTVEQLQRLIRSRVLQRLNVTIEGGVFETGELFHQFNRYIAALEQVRTALSVDESASAFYTMLLGVPIRERPGYILDRSRQQCGHLRADFIRTFSIANAVLLGGTK